MTHRDYLWCGLNMMLDDEEVLASLCPSCRSGVQEGRCPACGGTTGGQTVGENESFDWNRYEKMRQGGQI